MELVFGEGVRLAADLTAVLAVGTVLAMANLVLTVVVARTRPHRAPLVRWLAGWRSSPGVAYFACVRCGGARPHLLDVPRGRGGRLGRLPGASSGGRPRSGSRASRRPGTPMTRTAGRAAAAARLGAGRARGAPGPRGAETCGSDVVGGRRAPDPAGEPLGREEREDPGEPVACTAVRRSRRARPPRPAAAGCSAGGGRPGRRGRSTPTGRPAPTAAAGRRAAAPGRARRARPTSGSQCSTTSKAPTTSKAASRNGSASADAQTPSPGRSPRGSRSTVTRCWSPRIQATLGPSALPTSSSRAG